MKRHKGLRVLVSLIALVLVIVGFQANSVKAEDSKAPADEQYDIALTLVKMNDLKGWPKGNGQDGYYGQQLDISDYFGKDAATLDGVFFELRKDSKDGQLVQTGLTAQGGQLLFKNLKAGRYAIVVNKEKSQADAKTALLETTPVPLVVDLPVYKADGTWYTKGDKALHVYPKQTIEQRADKTSYKVVKKWKGTKLKSVTVHLKQNGKTVDSIDLSDSNRWEYTFTNLDKEDAQGKAFTYTAEEEVPKNYTATYSKLTDGTGLEITNTLTPTTPPRTPIIKTGTLTIYWIVGLAVLLIGIGYKFYKSEKH